MQKKIIKIIFLFLTCINLLAWGPKSDLNKRTSEGTSIPIEQWLIAGPISLPLPVSTSQEDEYPINRIFDLDILDPLNLWIKEGNELEWDTNITLEWKARTAEAGKLDLSAEGSVPQVVFLACYLDSSRWQKTLLDIKTDHLLKVFLDGVPVLTKSSFTNADAEESKKIDQLLELSQGKHSLLITAVHNPKRNPSWSIAAALKPEKKEYLAVSLSKKRSITADDIHNSRNIRNILISPDGKAVCFTVSQRNPRIKQTERWVEIRKLPGGELESTIRDPFQTPQNLAWSPDGKFLSGIFPGEKNKSDLRLIERKTGHITVLLDDVMGLRNAAWSPTGDFLIYSVTEESRIKDPKRQWLKGLEDRRGSFKTHLFKVMVESKIRRRLTAGSISANIFDLPGGNPISSDGNRIGFFKRQTDLSQRPFSKTEFLLLDLKENTAKNLFEAFFYSYRSASSLSPDGETIYFVGSQSIGNPGIHNEEDHDLYILSIDTGKIKCLTDKFDPTVDRIVLWRNDGMIFFIGKDRGRSQLYQTDSTGKQFKKLKTGVDVVREFDVSADGSVIVFLGESLQMPARLFVMDVKEKSPRLVYAPDQERWSDMIYGKVEDFNFKNPRGDTIDGWIYYPIDFDSQKKYPLIVNYYGGASGRTRGFNTGHLQYAANGYFAYMLNPSGGTGYGRKFSDLHVNDWGKIVIQDIITGVKEISSAKASIDSERIGIFGGSYGGTMTMGLTFKSDMFKAAISRYGVSNLASYWGGGYGMGYGAHAFANSYPWNRQDIYVDRSAVFNADKINTPLLLLHGIDDPNVPVIESDQLFTALSLLGREVNYIRFQGESHGIRGSDENRLLVPRIMMAWWDKYLKDQPDAHNNLWNSR